MSTQSLIKAYSSPKVAKKSKKLPVPDTKLTSEQENRSKARLLELLEEKLQGDEICAGLYRQLQARDALIETLNERIVTAEAAAPRLDLDSLAGKEKQLKAALEEKVGLWKRIKAAEDRIANLEEPLMSTRSTFREEREQLDLLVEALTEEVEVLKVQNRDKSEQVKAAKSDIVAMSGIVQDLTRLNAELNGKIEALNEEMERNNTEHYQAMKRAEQVEQMENELQQAQTDLQQTQSKLSNTQEKALAAKDLRELLYKAGKTIDEVIVQISAQDQWQDLASELDSLVKELRQEGRPSRTQDSETLSSLKVTIKDLKKDLETARRDLAKEQGTARAHEGRVASLEEELGRTKVEYKEKVGRLQERLAPLQELSEKASATRQALESRLEVADAETQKLQTETVHLTQRLQRERIRNEELRKAEEETRRTVRDLRTEVLQLQTQAATWAEDCNSKDQKAKEAWSRFMAATEEMWRRDNDILRRETQRLKLVEELNSLKTSIQHSQARLKVRSAEDFAQVSSQLEAKEREIQSLKRLLQTKPSKEALDDIARLNQAVVVLKELGEMEDRVESRKQAIAVIRDLQTELKSRRLELISGQDFERFPNLADFCSNWEPRQRTVGEVIDRAVSLVL